MRIADVLRNKGAAVATITPETSVAGLLTELTVHNIGAMVVVSPMGWWASSRSAMWYANCTSWAPTCSGAQSRDHDHACGDLHAR